MNGTYDTITARMHTVLGTNHTGIFSWMMAGWLHDSIKNLFMHGAHEFDNVFWVKGLCSS